MIEVNLLRQKTMKKRPKAQKGPSGGGAGNILPVVLAFLIVLIILPLVFFFQQMRINSVKNRTKQVQGDISRMAEELEARREAQKTLEGLQEQERLLRERINIIASLNSGRTAYVHLLQEVSDRFPQYTWISSLTESNGSVTITGLTLYDVVLPHLWDGLGESPYINNIQIESWALTNISDQTAVSFVLTASLLKTTLIQTGGAQ
ncbi:PilN domain-containing protein [candidate division WOR-3 bacterium]|nr:PilN domain-containing protein [candidate division WOR-3 bacterium]